jgi:hypothetical protein
MRAPRYHFPDRVRNATRSAAAEMVRDGEVVGSVAEFEAWIGERPALREEFVAGGDGTEFDAGDLFPLLQAMVGRAGGTVVVPGEAGRGRGRGMGRWYLVGFVVLLVVVAVWVVVTTGGGVR